MADVAITVSSTKYPLKVLNYQKVDITDFAPKSFTSSQTHSTMGLYTEASQDGFGHGFGGVEFTEPQRYHYTGHQVDTRHNFISLYSNYTQEVLSDSSITIVNKAITRNNILTLAASAGLVAKKPSNGAYATIISTTGYDLLDTGQYLLFGNSSRMQVCDVTRATAGGASTITSSTSNWDTNVFAGGTVVIFDGTSVGDSRTVSSNTATQITVSAPFTSTPTTSSYFAVHKATGNATNQPTNFRRLVVFGGNYWSYEINTNRMHFWAEDDGSDAEGGANDAAKVVVGSVARGLGIVNIMPFQNQLWVFRRDGAWTINDQDANAVAYHTLDFSAEYNTENFATVTVWQGFLIFGVRNRLYKYRSGLQDITPPVWDTYPPYKQYGGFRGLTIRGKFLYVVGVSNEANSDEALETTTGFASLLCHDGVGWHKLMDAPAGTPPFLEGSNLWYMPSTDKLYWHSRTAATSYFWSIQFQTYSDVPYASFPTTGNHNLYTSYYDFTYKRVPKSFASVLLHGDFPSGTSVIVSYRIDSTLTWTVLGTFDADYEEIDFAATVTGTRIQFRLNLQTSSAANTPVIKALVCKLMMRPAVLYGVYCDVQVSSDLLNVQQRVLGLTSREIETALLAARDSVSPITFSDLAGVDHTAYLASVKFRMVEYADAEGLQYIAQCTFVYV